jgi:hypothetical protein
MFQEKAQVRIRIRSENPVKWTQNLDRALEQAASGISGAGNRLV